MLNSMRTVKKALNISKGVNPFSTRANSTRSNPFIRSNHKTIIGLSTLGAVAFGLTVASTLSSISELNIAPKEGWESLGFPILLADASSPPTIEGIYKDPQTSTPFPSTLKSDNSNLILIGTGVRVVSFLSVKVYCAAFYVDEKVLNKLSTIEGWKGFTADKLLPPFPKKDGSIAGEELIGKLLDTKNDFAVIITPLRSTSLPHLRDGFARAIVARLKQPHVAAGFGPDEGEGHAASISELKGFFPNRPLAKGAPLYVHLSGVDGSVRFAVDNVNNPSGIENLGTLHNPPLARQLFLSYFGDAGAISEELRKSAAAGFAGETR